MIVTLSVTTIDMPCTDNLEIELACKLSVSKMLQTYNLYAFVWFVLFWGLNLTLPITILAWTPATIEDSPTTYLFLYIDLLLTDVRITPSLRQIKPFTSNNTKNSFQLAFKPDVLLPLLSRPDHLSLFPD